MPKNYPKHLQVTGVFSRVPVTCHWHIAHNDGDLDSYYPVYGRAILSYVKESAHKIVMKLGEVLDDEVKLQKPSLRKAVTINIYGEMDSVIVDDITEINWQEFI